MKISDSQIQELYTFTRQHFVEFYDLQTELVDHLANDIENIWETQPNLSFEEAKEQSFKKFGVFGFMEVIEARQKAMNKKYYKYLWEHFKQWFTLPQLLITLSIFLGFYLMFSTKYGMYCFIVSFLMFSIWAFYKGFKLKRAYKSKKNTIQKKWLLEDIIFKQASGYGVLFMCQVFNIINFLDLEMLNITAVNSIVSIFLTITILGSYISLVLLPNEAESLLKETYPEYSL